MALVRPKIRDDLAFVVLDGEAVIYDTRNQNIHHLNPTATRLKSSALRRLEPPNL